jgi:hypothetical protein
MTSVVSLRLPAALERTIRHNAAESNMPVADVVRWVLEHALDGQYSFAALPDPRRVLDAKLDIRLPAELVAKVRTESQRLNVSISVYSRVILFAYYTKRLIVAEIGGRYTLAQNHDQKKSA